MLDFNPFANPFDMIDPGEEELLQKVQVQPEQVPVQPAGLQFSGTTGRSATNNNPLNLEYRKGSYQDKYGAEMEPVSKSGKQRFAKFPSMEAGYKAGLDQIRLDQSRLHTLASFVNKFAPPHENPTGQIIQQYANALGVSPDTPLSKIPAEKLIVPMLARESSTRIVGGREQEIFAKLKNPGKSGPKPFKEYQVASAGDEIPGPPVIEDPFANPAKSGGPFDQPGRTDPFNKPEQVVSEQEEQPEQPQPTPQELMKQKALNPPNMGVRPEIVRPMLEMGGMLGGGALGAAGGLAAGPAAPVAVPALTTAGEMGGYYIGKKAADYFFGRERGGLANTLLGKIGETPAAKEMEDIREAGLYAMGFPAATAFGKRTIEIGADVYAALASKMSSVAKDVVKTVVDGAKSGRPWVDMGLTGRMSGRDVTDLAVANFEKINAEASAEYAAGANKIVEKYGQNYLIPRPTDRPINKSLFQRINDDILVSKGFGKGGYVPKKPDGSLDWNSSSFGVSEENRGLAKQAMEKILEYGQKPRTLENLHNLKNYLDGLWKQSSDDTVKGFLTKATNEVKHDISFKIPEYKELSDIYHTVMLQVEDINKKIIPKTTELTKKEWVADQVLTKLTSLMRKEESPIARNIAKRLLGVQGYEALAGHMFTPEIGKLGARGAAIELGAATLSPHLVPIIAASSPKLQGEFLAAYGRFLAKSEGSFEPAMRAAGYGLTRVGKKKDNTTNDTE